MSGCAVWCIPDFAHSLAKLTYFPTGIVIEYDEKKSFFVSTRLRVVTEILRSKFNVNLPPSRKIDFHITNTTSIPFTVLNKEGRSIDRTKKI